MFWMVMRAMIHMSSVRPIRLVVRGVDMTLSRPILGALITAAVVLIPTTSARGAPTSRAATTLNVQFRVFARTGLRLTDVVWTGRQFLYVDNTTNRVAAAGPAGTPLTPFATMPHQVEETRCRPSPGAHGFPAGYLYCHAPDNKIYRISADGTRVTVVAILPHSARSDGALAFDTGGAFGYTLLAATGRSGSPTARGGSVFTISPSGIVRRIGSYPTPGGADEIALAPAGFGVVGGQVLIPVDAGATGSLVAMDARGRVRTLLMLPDGPNPIVVLARGQAPAAGQARAGLYVADTLSRDVYLAPASELRAYVGAVVVGSELQGLFWVLRPHGGGFAATKLATTLTAKHYNFEGAIYVAG